MATQRQRIASRTRKLLRRLSLGVGIAGATVGALAGDNSPGVQLLAPDFSEEVTPSGSAPSDYGFPQKRLGRTWDQSLQSDAARVQSLDARRPGHLQQALNTQQTISSRQALFNEARQRTAQVSGQGLFRVDQKTGLIVPVQLEEEASPLTGKHRRDSKVLGIPEIPAGLEPVDALPIDISSERPDAVQPQLIVPESDPEFELPQHEPPVERGELNSLGSDFDSARSLPHAIPNSANNSTLNTAPFTAHYHSNPAQNARDGSCWISPYHDRVLQAPEHESSPLLDEEILALPEGYSPWWTGPILEPIRNSGEQLPVDVDLLVLGALEFAPHIRAVKMDPCIRYSTFLEENAAFDWIAFAETRFDDIDEPIGNSLTTGFPDRDRFKNHIWSGEAGLRRKNEIGGEFEIAQKFGWEKQNSRFFIPEAQGTARIELNYTQPLLNGAGTAFNNSRIVLAQIDTNLAHDEVSQTLQDHLLKVTEAYWELYRARSVFLQREKLLLSALEIQRTLAGRQDVDALQRQVLRSKAAVAGRRSEILRAATAIRNAESQLRLLVNDPGILDVGYLELIPNESPRNDRVSLSMTGSLQTALIHRPDVSQAIRELRAASVRVGVAENELLPRLDLVLKTYANGLQGNSDIPEAFSDQYFRGRPSYAVGFLFEVPLGNHAAKAREQRRRYEYSRAVQEFRVAVETGLTEVEIAVREADTAYREMLSQYQAMVAAETETSYLDSRWRVLPGGDRSTTLLLEDLLDAQERLADSESEFVLAQVNYVTSLARIRRATGTLLNVELGTTNPAVPRDIDSIHRPIEPTPIAPPKPVEDLEDPPLPELNDEPPAPPEPSTASSRTSTTRRILPAGFRSRIGR